ncbi:MAG: hypothetical protein HUU06_07955, partial [Planctomycetaceae bacterium]|nr:hypothetical protein [Planctomycetaceae bacterium]
MAALLAERGVRLVLLVPGGMALPPLAGEVEVREERRSSEGALRRLHFDQVVLPWRLRGRSDAAVYGSGSHVPLGGAARRVALLRNAIYFDPAFLLRETPLRRARWVLEGGLIAAAAAR